jgi:mannose-6-phosphate isomerase-like protein (cupin superfamily)
MSFGCCTKQLDNGENPYVANIEQMGIQNSNFRTTIWTGRHLQMTLMCIPPCDEIGLEVHENIDQFIRVEQGIAVAIMGENKTNICKGDAVFIPAGTWHNIVNVGKKPLKVSVIYAPPNHPKGTVHRTKADAEME